MRNIFIICLFLLFPLVSFTQLMDFNSEEANRQAEEIRQYITVLQNQGLSQDEIQNQLTEFFSNYFGTSIDFNQLQNLNNQQLPNSGLSNTNENLNENLQNIPINTIQINLASSNQNYLMQNIIKDEFYIQGYQYYLDNINYPRYLEKYSQIENNIFLANKGKFPIIAILSYGFIPYYEDTFSHILVNEGEVDADNIDNDQDGFIDNLILTSFKNRSAGYISAVRDLDFSILNTNTKEILNNYPGFISQIVIGSELNNNNFAGLLPSKDFKMMLIDITDKNGNPIYLQQALEYLINMKKRHNIVAAISVLPNTPVKNVNYTTRSSLEKAGIEYINSYKYKYSIPNSICLNNIICIEDKIISDLVLTGIYANLKANCITCDFTDIERISNGNYIDMEKIIGIEQFENLEGLGYFLF